MNWLSMHKWSLIIVFLIIVLELIIYVGKFFVSSVEDISIYFLIITGVLGITGFPLSNKLEMSKKSLVRFLSSLGIGGFITGIIYGNSILVEIKDKIDLYLFIMPLIIITLLVIILFLYNINRGPRIQ